MARTSQISVNNGTVMVNDAAVVKADVVASNGVIHVIDTVLLPKDLVNGENHEIESFRCDRSCASSGWRTQLGSG